MTTYVPPQRNAALVVGPDDVLVVSFRHALSPEEFARILGRLREAVPRNSPPGVVIVGNADQIAVIHKGQDPP